MQGCYSYPLKSYKCEPEARQTISSTAHKLDEKDRQEGLVNEITCEKGHKRKSMKIFVPAGEVHP